MSNLDTEHSKAKFLLLKNDKAIFFSTIIYSLKQEFTESVPTAGVNATHLYLNPTWYGSLSVKEKAGLLMHEAMHIALMHNERDAGYEKEKYNKAADYVINNHLLKEGYELPAKGLWDKKYNDMTTEEVYALLPDEPEGYDCDLMEGEGDSATSKAKLQEVLVRASLAAKQNDSYGSLPGELQRKLEALLDPVIDWKTALQRYLTERNKDDYSWSRP